MLRKKIVALMLVLAAAFGVAAAGTYAVLASQPPDCYKVAQPMDFGKKLGD